MGDMADWSIECGINEYALDTKCWGEEEWESYELGARYGVGGFWGAQEQRNASFAERENSGGRNWRMGVGVFAERTGVYTVARCMFLKRGILK